MHRTLLLAALSLSGSALADTGGQYRVVGGTEAAVGAWDDTVAVRFQGQWGCTGVLIAPDLVLTAGHCASGISVQKVKIGANDANGDGEEIDVIDQVTYPDWARSLDLALLFLETSTSTYATSRLHGN